MRLRDDVREGEICRHTLGRELLALLRPGWGEGGEGGGGRGALTVGVRDTAQSINHHLPELWIELFLLVPGVKDGESGDGG